MYVTHPTDDSIFGDTYHGVPNPLVPHVHPYPTRFHGAIFTEPRFMLPYVENPWDVPPYMGGSGPMRTGDRTPPCSLAGEDRPALLSSLTGLPVGDAAVGAAVGYLIAPAGQRGLYTGIGGIACMLAGTLGLLATAGIAFYGRRP